MDITPDMVDLGQVVEERTKYRLGGAECKTPPSVLTDLPVITISETPTENRE